MTKLLNTYTFLTKETVYYSVTVCAETEDEAREIASDPDYITYCDEEEDVLYLEEQDEYEVAELLEKDED